MRSTSLSALDTINLPPRPGSAAEARRWTRERLHALDADDASETAELLVSELVTNVVLHAHTEACLSIGRLDGLVRVRVQDFSPIPPQRRAHAVTAATGRGLSLLVAYAAAWGVDIGVAGKTVWFTIDPAAPADEDAMFAEFVPHDWLADDLD